MSDFNLNLDFGIGLWNWTWTWIVTIVFAQIQQAADILSDRQTGAEDIKLMIPNQ